MKRGVRAVEGREKVGRRRLTSGVNVGVRDLSGVRQNIGCPAFSALRGVVSILKMAPGRLLSKR